MLACQPSLLLDKKFPDKGSEFAAEGTYAHAMAEFILRRYLSDDPDPECLDDFEKSEFYSEAMVDYVHTYTDACMEKIVAARKADAEAVFLPEQRLEFNSVVQGGFGTGDMVIISDKMLEVIDLKYGKGVRVEAEGNPQLQLYALGAIETFGSIYDFDEVSAYAEDAVSLLGYTGLLLTDPDTSLTEEPGIYVRPKHQLNRMEVAVLFAEFASFVAGTQTSRAMPWGIIESWVEK